MDNRHRHLHRELPSLRIYPQSGLEKRPVRIEMERICSRKHAGDWERAQKVGEPEFSMDRENTSRIIRLEDIAFELYFK